MQLINNKTNDNYTVKQLKLPLVIEKLINISNPVYTFCDVMDHIDLTPYFVEGKGYKTGRPRCDAEKLLKVILFAFMENGYCSLREIEKLCNNDIRFMYLLDEMKAPTFATFGNFIRNELTTNIEDIFNDINSYIFDKEKVDLNHTYIDGTKIEANANKYTWVWKKSCTRNRLKVFGYVSELIDEINSQVLNNYGLKIETRDEYAIEYLEEILDKYAELTSLNPDTFVHGKGRRKTLYQRQYEKLTNYKERLKTYARHIEICGDNRNSYSKTDHSASFMRIKTDYMGNDQLLPAYNL
ncbi:transposase [Eubacterium ventriosum]|jgi:transposase|uniref:transposase n=1 Tax=Eubacterium ventriosum TaxID=39496 RepID=UPI003521AA7C